MVNSQTNCCLRKVDFFLKCNPNHLSNRISRFPLVAFLGFLFVFFYLGGRPLNWLWISEECLTLMNDLQQRLYVYVNHHNMTISKDQKTVLETPSRHYQGIYIINSR